MIKGKPSLFLTNDVQCLHQNNMPELFRGPAYKEMDIPPQGKFNDFNRKLPIELMAISSYRPKFSFAIERKNYKE